jgi:hypothetical protein
MKKLMYYKAQRCALKCFKDENPEISDYYQQKPLRTAVQAWQNGESIVVTIAYFVIPGSQKDEDYREMQYRVSSEPIEATRVEKQ